MLDTLPSIFRQKNRWRTSFPSGRFVRTDRIPCACIIFHNTAMARCVHNANKYLASATPRNQDFLRVKGRFLKQCQLRKRPHLFYKKSLAHQKDKRHINYRELITLHLNRLFPVNKDLLKAYESSKMASGPRNLFTFFQLLKFPSFSQHSFPKARFGCLRGPMASFSFPENLLFWKLVASASRNMMRVFPESSCQHPLGNLLP